MGVPARRSREELRGEFDIPVRSGGLDVWKPDAAKAGIPDVGQHMALVEVTDVYVLDDAGDSWERALLEHRFL